MLTVTEDSQIHIMVLIKQTLIRVLLMHIVVLAVHFSITTFSFFPDLTCFLQRRVGKKKMLTALTPTLPLPQYMYFYNQIKKNASLNCSGVQSVLFHDIPQIKVIVFYSR